MRIHLLSLCWFVISSWKKPFDRQRGFFPSSVWVDFYETNSVFQTSHKYTPVVGITMYGFRILDTERTPSGSLAYE